MISLEERYQNFKKQFKNVGVICCGCWPQKAALRNSFMQLEKNVELLSAEALRTFEEWKRLLSASDEIRKLLYW